MLIECACKHTLVQDIVHFNTCKYQSTDLLVQIKKHILILDTAKGFAVPLK